MYSGRSCLRPAPFSGSTLTLESTENLPARQRFVAVAEGVAGSAQPSCSGGRQRPRPPAGHGWSQAAQRRSKPARCSRQDRSNSAGSSENMPSALRSRERLVAEEQLGRAGVDERDRYPGPIGRPTTPGHESVEGWGAAERVARGLRRHHHDGAEAVDLPGGRRHQLGTRFPGRATEPAEQLPVMQEVRADLFGAGKVHIRWPTASSTSSCRNTANAAARLAPQDGQRPRPLQLHATR